MNGVGRSLCMALVAVAQVGCYAPRLSTAARDWVRTELYFGLSRPDGSVITDAEWVGFVNASVLPRFPAGFTVVPAQGYFGSRDQSPRAEPARLLILFHDRPRGTVRTRTSRRSRRSSCESSTRNRCFELTRPCARR